MPISDVEVKVQFVTVAYRRYEFSSWAERNDTDDSATRSPWQRRSCRRYLSH